MSWDHLPQSLYCRSNAVCCKVVLKDLMQWKGTNAENAFFVLVIVGFVFVCFCFSFISPILLLFFVGNRLILQGDH